MSLVRALRISGALVLLPCLFGLGVWVALTDLNGTATGYPAADLSAASGQLILTGPVVGAYLCYRLAPFLWLMARARPARSRVRVLLTVWSPVLLGGPAAGVLAMVSATRIVPGDPVAWQVVGVSWTAGLACGALGTLMSRALPRVIGIPLVAVGLFFWFGYTPSRTEALLRNMNSGFGVCCTESQRPAVALVLGSVVLAAVVVALCLLVVCSPAWQRRSGVAHLGALLSIVVLAVGLGAAAATAAPGRLDMTAVETRTTAVRCTQKSGYEVCVWPENRSQTRRFLRLLHEFDEVLVDRGLPGARVASQRLRDHRGAALRADIARRYSDDNVRYSLVEGYSKRALRCPGGDMVEQQPTAFAAVGLVAGLSARQLLEAGVPPAALARARATIDRSPEVFAQWFRGRSCRSDPRSAR